MQDLQNIPNPDVNSTQREGDFGTHSDIERENEANNSDVENIPLPPTEPKPAPVEEPPEESDKARIDEPRRKPTQIV